jgi:hypothetical protein
MQPVQNVHAVVAVVLLLATVATHGACPASTFITEPNTLWEAVDCDNVTNIIVRAKSNITIRIVRSSTKYLPSAQYTNVSLIALDSTTIANFTLEIRLSNVTVSSLLNFRQSSVVTAILGVSIYIHSSVVLSTQTNVGAIAMRTAFVASAIVRDFNITIVSSHILVNTNSKASLTVTNEVHAFLHVLAGGDMRGITVVIRHCLLEALHSSIVGKRMYFLDIAADHSSSDFFIMLEDNIMHIGSTFVSTNPNDEVNDYGCEVIGLRLHVSTVGAVATLSGLEMVLSRMNVTGNTTSTFSLVSIEAGIVVEASVVTLRIVNVTMLVAGPVSITYLMTSRYGTIISIVDIVHSQLTISDVHIDTSVVIGMLNRNVLSLVDTVAVQVAELSCTNKSVVRIDGGTSVRVRNEGNGCFSTYNANSYFSIAAFLAKISDNSTVIIEDTVLVVSLDPFCPVQRTGYFNRLNGFSAQLPTVTSNSGVYGFLVGSFLCTAAFSSSSITVRNSTVDAVPPNISKCGITSTAYFPAPPLLQVYVSIGALMFSTKDFLVETLDFIGSSVGAVPLLKAFIASGKVDFGIPCGILDTSLTVVGLVPVGGVVYESAGGSIVSVGYPRMSVNISLVMTMSAIVTACAITIRESSASSGATASWGFSAFHAIVGTLTDSSITLEGLETLRPSTALATAIVRLTRASAVGAVVRMEGVYVIAGAYSGTRTPPHLLLLERSTVERNTTLEVRDGRAVGLGAMVAATDVVGASFHGALHASSHVVVHCFEWDGSPTVPIADVGVVRGQVTFTGCLPSLSTSLELTQTPGAPAVSVRPVLSASIAALAMVATAALSVAQSASVASPLSRSLAVLRIAQCSGADALLDTLGIDAHPTRIPIGNTEGGSQRGSLVMNICVLWGGLALLSTWKAVLLARHRDGGAGMWTFSDALAMFQLPGAWSMFVMPLLCPVVSSAVQLISGNAQGVLGGADGAGGAAALLLVVTLALFTSYWLRPGLIDATLEGRVGNGAWYHSGCRARTVWKRITGAHTLHECAKEVVRYLAAPLGVWRLRRSGSHPPTLRSDKTQVHRKIFFNHLFPMFGDSMPGRAWWLLVDMWAGVALGVLGGLLPSTEEACSAVLWIAAIVLCGVAAASVALWPLLSSRIDGFVYQVCAVGGAAMGISAAVGASDVVLSGLAIALLPISFVGVIVGALKWLWGIGQRIPAHSMELEFPSTSFTTNRACGRRPSNQAPRLNTI